MCPGETVEFVRIPVQECESRVRYRAEASVAQQTVSVSALHSCRPRVGAVDWFGGGEWTSAMTTLPLCAAARRTDNQADVALGESTMRQNDRLSVTPLSRHGGRMSADWRGKADRRDLAKRQVCSA